MKATHIGTVIWFDVRRGFGFIAPDVRSRILGLAEDKDLFVHYSQIVTQAHRKNLYEGQRVEFDLLPDFRGGGNDGVMAGAVAVI